MNNMMNLANLAVRLKMSNNPLALLEQLGGNNPVIQKAIQMTQGKNPEQIMQIARNLAKEKGVDFEQFKNGIIGNIG